MSHRSDFCPLSSVLSSETESYRARCGLTCRRISSRKPVQSVGKASVHSCSRCALDRCTEVCVCYLGKGQRFRQRHSQPRLHPECYLSYTLTNLQQDTRKCRTTVFYSKGFTVQTSCEIYEHPVTQQYQSIEQFKFMFQMLNV